MCNCNYAITDSIAILPNLNVWRWSKEKLCGISTKRLMFYFVPPKWTSIHAFLPRFRNHVRREGSFKRVQEPCQQGKEALRGRRGGWERSSVFCTKTAAGSTNSQQLWLPARGQLQPLAEEPLTGDDLGGECYGYGPGRLHTPKDGSYMSM